MEYIASLSGGKDSLAMVLRLMEEKRPLTKCVFFDAGMEFGAIYRNIDKVEPLLNDYGCELVRLYPPRDFLLDMMIKPVCEGKCNEHYGYEWCGGKTRWMTSIKIKAIEDYEDSLGECIEYVGIAVDEPQRIREKNYPLVEWNMTEADCLAYCRAKGWSWPEDGIDLYDVLDRVSCWCCGNKNLKELKAIYKHLPRYWGYLKGMQSRIDRPFKGEYTIFDLEERFKQEERQLSLF